MAEDSDGDYSLSDDGDDTPAPSARAQAKEVAEKAAVRFSSMLKRMLVAERPAVAKPSKTRCKRDLGTLDLELAPPQPSGKRQRKPAAHFEAGSAKCFVRAKVDAEAVAAAEVAAGSEDEIAPGPVLPWVRTGIECARKQANFDCKAKKERAQQRAKKKAAAIAELVGRLDENEEFSWRQRRKMALKAFVASVEFGYSKLVSYHVAKFAASVSERVVQDWVRRWRESKEGFEASFSWGGQCPPSILTDEDVMEASKTWWREHAPKKGASSCSSFLTMFSAGKTRVRIADFHTFLCGNKDKHGLLHRVGQRHGFSKVLFSEERLRQYTHFLGFGYSETSSGAFNDEHESE